MHLGRYEHHCRRCWRRLKRLLNLKYLLLKTSHLLLDLLPSEIFLHGDRIKLKIFLELVEVVAVFVALPVIANNHTMEPRASRPMSSQ